VLPHCKLNSTIAIISAICFESFVTTSIAVNYSVVLVFCNKQKKIKTGHRYHARTCKAETAGLSEHSDVTWQTNKHRRSKTTISSPAITGPGRTKPRAGPGRAEPGRAGPGQAAVHYGDMFRLHSITVVCPRLLTVGDSVVLFFFSFLSFFLFNFVRCFCNVSDVIVSP